MIQVDSRVDSSRCFLQQVFMSVTSHSNCMWNCEFETRIGWSHVPDAPCMEYFPTFTMYLVPYVFTICIFPIFSINIPYIEHLGDASIRHGNDSRCPCWSWRCVKAPSWHRTPGS